MYEKLFENNDAVIVFGSSNRFYFTGLETSFGCVLIMPDRKIMEVTNEYLILYNNKDVSLCKLVYWDEILSWQYRWHPDADELIIELCDHSVEKVEAFNRKKFTRYLKEYANGKEMKVRK